VLGQFWKKLMVSFEKVGLIIMAVILLHNFIVDCR